MAKLAVLSQDRRNVIIRAEAGDLTYSVGQLSKNLQSGARVPKTLKEFEKLTGLTGPEASRLHSAASNQVMKAMKLIYAAVLSKERAGMYYVSTSESNESDFKPDIKDEDVDWILLRPKEYERLVQLAKAGQAESAMKSGGDKQAQELERQDLQTSSVTKRAAPQGINPETGDKMKFKASKAFKYKTGLPKQIGPASTSDILGEQNRKRIVNDPGEQWSPRKKRRTTHGGVGYEEVVGSTDRAAEHDLSRIGGYADRVRNDNQSSNSKSGRKKRRNR
jgi:hypothetical protein